ncbi:MAG: hypothetical protein WCK36_03315, partial [Candidatus Firestonebacteria bacterium]
MPKGAVTSFCGADNGKKSVLYALVNTELYKSVDDGDNWKSAMGKGLKAKANYNKVACAVNDVSVVYLNVYREFLVYKSMDAGESWRNCYTPGVGTGNTEIGWLSYSYGPGWGGPFLTGFTVNTANADYAMGTNYGESIMTSDGGKTWRQIYSKAVGTPRKNSTWTSIGLEVTTTWNYYVDPFEKNRHYICYTDFGFARSEDGGNTWAHSTDGSPWVNTFYQLAFDEKQPGVMYAAASGQHDIPTWLAIETTRYGGGVIKSVDFGKTWVNISKGLPDRPVVSIVKDKDTLYVTSFKEGVYRSDDLGQTWVKKSNGLGTAENQHVYTLQLHKDGTLFCSVTGLRAGTKFTMTGSGVYKSTDKGENWTLLRANRYTTNYNVDPDNSNII